MIKGKDPKPDPYLWLMDPDPGGPKTCGFADPNQVPDPDPQHLLKGKYKDTNPSLWKNTVSTIFQSDQFSGER